MKAPIAFAIGCIFTTLLTDSVSAVHCNKQHTVVDGDTCKSIAKTYKISEKVIGRLNPAVDSVCDHLEDGLKLCVGSAIKSLNKASPKTTSKKAIHTKKKMTTIIKSSKKTATKKTSKKTSKKVSKKVSKKASKTADGAVQTPAVRNKDPKEGSAKSQKLESTDDNSDASTADSDAQPTDDSTDSSDVDNSAESTDDSTDSTDDSTDSTDDSTDSTDDSTDSTDDSDAQPTDDGSDNDTNSGPTPTQDSTDDSDNGSAQPTDDGSNDNSTPTDDGSDNAQPTDDGSNQVPGQGPQPGTQPDNSTQPALDYFDALTVQLTSADDFCLLLPSSPGGKKDNNNKIDVEAISKSEGSAISFCLKKSAEKAPKAKEMPVGLIKSAYFFKNETADYSQISGTINPKAYMLSDKDYGGQYDNHGKGAPANSMCYGYKYFVELIEPNTNDFCIRCCNVYEDCNAGRSAYGCQRVVSNGRYS